MREEGPNLWMEERVCFVGLHTAPIASSLLIYSQRREDVSVLSRQTQTG